MFEKTLKFNYEKETKGTVRFKEESENPADYVIGTLYIRKTFLGEERPKKLEVTIRQVEEQL
jgi:hypothetical protein